MKHKFLSMPFVALVLLCCAVLPAAANAPALITAADYTDGYTVRLVPAPAVSWTIVPGAFPVFLTADGYPAVRTASGQIVYMGSPLVSVAPLSVVTVGVAASPVVVASPSWIPAGAPFLFPTQALPVSVPVGLPALIVK
jgi:hypothetical protein